MPDPLEQLRDSDEPMQPRDSFGRALRRQIVDALGVDPADIPIELPGRTPMTTTTTTTAAPVQATGVRSLTAYLTVHDGAGAMDFYAAAFGAVEDFRVVGDDGRLGHAEMTMGAVRIQLSDEYPEMDVRSPQALGGSGVALSLAVDDCDAAWTRATEAGATGLQSPEDQAHGNRTAVVLDPFGHRWFLMQPLEVFDVETYAARETGGGFEVVAGPGATAAGADERVTLDGLWASLIYDDAPAMIRFLVDVVGFEELLVVPDEADPSMVVHSELRWPEGGIVQVASVRPDSPHAARPVRGGMYVISRQIEAVHDRCVAGGATITMALHEVDYSETPSKAFSCSDPEGGSWFFGEYGATR